MEEFGGDSDLGSGKDSRYVLLSNIYAAFDNWEKAERMKRLMSIKGFQKVLGYSSFVLNGPETSFCASIT